MLHSVRFGFNPRAANAARDQLRAKNPRSSSNLSGSTINTSGTAVSRKIILLKSVLEPSDNPKLGNRNDEAAPAFAKFLLLTEDLVSKVPSQKQYIIGPGF